MPNMYDPQIMRHTHTRETEKGREKEEEIVSCCLRLGSYTYENVVENQGLPLRVKRERGRARGWDVLDFLWVVGFSSRLSAPPSQHSQPSTNI